ncbi:hypothetical protein [Lapillicoccus sp.]|uniref:hypothetical protein n=1 Tax=Lapillicoccus sp. TaxID=1909287 RepID=UPI003264896E
MTHPVRDTPCPAPRSISRSSRRHTRTVRRAGLLGAGLAIALVVGAASTQASPYLNGAESWSGSTSAVGGAASAAAGGTSDAGDAAAVDGSAVPTPVDDSADPTTISDPAPIPAAADLGAGPIAAAPDAASSAAPAATSCTLAAKLVPTCGVLWGSAPLAFGGGDRMKNVLTFESQMGRPMDIYHGYHTNGQVFPTAYERQIALDPKNPRLLLLNWRPALDMSWAAVAQGKADARIDQAAQNIKSFPGKLFIAVWAEGEHYVQPAAGSGMTASDYNAMSRHVITRLKAQGAANAVFVQIFQGYPAYAVQSWWPSMYPGDDVIDWIATDSYNNGRASGSNSGDFTNMVNRTKGSWPGWYNWATRNHPGKPLMISEWGVWYSKAEPGQQAVFYDKVRQQLAQFPAIKAMLYFNTKNHPLGTDAIDTTAAGQAAYRQLSASLPRIDLTNRR